jgi:ABC-type Fe3+-siderophore transport system permease subunit
VPILRGLAAYIGMVVGIFLLMLVIPQEDRWILYVVFGGGLLTLNRTIGQETQP